MHRVIVVITVFIAVVSLQYFYNLFSYSAIQTQVCNKLSQCSENSSVHILLTKTVNK